MLEQTGLQHQDITNLLALRNQVSQCGAMPHNLVYVACIYQTESLMHLTTCGSLVPASEGECGADGGCRCG